MLIVNAHKASDFFRRSRNQSLIGALDRIFGDVVASCLSKARRDFENVHSKAPSLESKQSALRKRYAIRLGMPEVLALDCSTTLQ